MNGRRLQEEEGGGTTTIRGQTRTDPWPPSVPKNHATATVFWRAPSGSAFRFFPNPSLLYRGQVERWREGL